MKKLISVLLALMLCLGAALAEDVDYTGTWYLNAVVSEGVSVNPSTLGIDLTMTLNADNTASGEMSGMSTEGTWTAEGEGVVVTFEAETMSLVLQDGNLVTEVDGSQAVFGREKAEVETFVPGEAKADATMADYNGTWNATLVEMMGMQLPMTDLGMAMQIIVEDGKVTMLDGVGEEATALEGTGTVENGVLNIMGEEDTVAVPLQYHEGDVLSLASDMGEGMVVTFYFEKVVE